MPDGAALTRATALSVGWIRRLCRHLTTSYCFVLFSAAMPSRNIATRWLTSALALISSNLMPAKCKGVSSTQANNSCVCSAVIRLCGQKGANGVCKSCHSPYSPSSVVPENISAPSFPACLTCCVWASGRVISRPSMAERAQLTHTLMS